MTQKKPRDVSASVRARLLNAARERGEENQYVLMRYAAERLLYRLSLTPYRERFILKGAKLFEIWTGESHRPTRDVDFLGFGSPVVAELVTVFQEICRQEVPEDDGISFDPASVRGAPARQDQEYQGAAIVLQANLGNAVIPVQIDFGFGDAITPAAEEVELPTLLPLPPPRLRTYPRETVIAEKLQAMVMLGIANSRMKDYYDLWFLAQEFSFDGLLLQKAVVATFQRRNTEIPSQLPTGLSREFYDSSDKQAQWRAFVRRSRLAGEGAELSTVTALLTRFLWPLLTAAWEGRELAAAWNPATLTWEIRVSDRQDRAPVGSAG
ncbi:MAG: nucleotidyl transferase AbiEii/AbiGii toxin family protein [Armatimonadota bacterium]